MTGLEPASVGWQYAPRYWLRHIYIRVRNCGEIRIWLTLNITRLLKVETCGKGEGPDEIRVLFHGFANPQR